MNEYYVERAKKILKETNSYKEAMDTLTAEGLMAEDALVLLNAVMKYVRRDEKKEKDAVR